MRVSVATLVAVVVLSMEVKAGVVADGDFESWHFDSWSLSGNRENAWVTRVATGGRPGAHLSVTTRTGLDAAGIAIKDDFFTTAPLEGEPFELSLDVLGRGQRVWLIIEQFGGIYYNRLNAVESRGFAQFTLSGVFRRDQFQHIPDTPGPALADFDGGTATRFGFAGENNASGLLTQFYDNFRLESPALVTQVPESSTLINMAVGSFFLLLVQIRFAAKLARNSPCTGNTCMTC